MGAKMFGTFSFILIMSCLVGGGLMYAIDLLGDLQDETQRRSAEAIEATEASFMGDVAYRIIADTVINRKLDETVTEWNAFKEESGRLLT
ncbi:MAG: hypothetical protein ACLGPL_10060, partial [Acidobacteriota bacterium]